MHRSYPFDSNRENKEPGINRKKGQWFLISAVIAVGAFLAISFVMKDFFLVDASDTARLSDNYYYWNVQDQFYEVVSQSQCGPGNSIMDSNLQEFISFSRSDLARKGYFLHVQYNIQTCNSTDHSF